MLLIYLFCRVDLYVINICGIGGGRNAYSIFAYTDKGCSKPDARKAVPLGLTVGYGRDLSLRNTDLFSVNRYSKAIVEIIGI
jgi:hypothetical protein